MADNISTSPASDVSVVGDHFMTLLQNSSGSLDLKVGDASGASITQNPTHGVVSVRGTVVTYRVTNPLYSGTDSFSYKLSNGSVDSNEARVNVVITAVASGTSTLTENYSGSQYVLSGWKSFSSTFGHTVNSVTGFASATYNGVLSPSRHFGIYGDNASYAGDSAYSSLFSILPVDGAAGPMKDWPWKAELIHFPECGYDTTITMKLAANGGQYPLGAILLNYDIEDNASDQQEMTGYQLFFNSGGGSLTLSRFNHAHELATAYMDRWPNTSYGNEAMANPIESGPYKGWNYRNGVWPAGGNVGVGTNIFLAVRYQYNVTTKDTVISFEARNINGTDSTPGSWDNVVTLSGADSLLTGGHFGLMGLNYHTDSVLLTTDFDVTEFKLVCVLP